jgi:type II secretion system protein L
MLGESELTAAVTSLLTEHHVQVDHEQLDADTLLIQAQSVLLEQPINLLQGEYRVRKSRTAQRRWWWLSACLLFAWVTVNTALPWYHNHALETQSQHLTENIKASYREAFPDARNIPQPREQMQRKLVDLRQARASGGFLTYMAVSGAALKTLKNHTITAISYRGGEFNMDLRLQNLQDLDAIKQTLTRYPDIQLKVQNVSAAAGTISARLNLSRQ